MARIESDPNYYTPATFPRATAATDIFKKEDVQGVAAALSTHTHGTGKGLALDVASAIPAGSITSAMIADGTIQTADIAPGAITGIASAASLSAESTTSATMVALVDPKLVAVGTTGGTVVVTFNGVFFSAAPNPGFSELQFGLRVDGGGWNVLGVVWSPGANFRFSVPMLLNFGALAAAAHTFEVGWSASAGYALSTSTAASRVLLVQEFKK